MFIFRVDNLELRVAKVSRLKELIAERNNPDVNLEVWIEQIVPRKPGRKNGRVKQQGSDTKQRTRYIVSPVGTTNVRFNLSSKEKERYGIRS